MQIFWNSSSRFVRYGGFGNLSPDPDPKDALEIVIIHAPGTPLLEDPDGGSRFIWKDWPGRSEAK
jgi:hypothetical protein